VLPFQALVADGLARYRVQLCVHLAPGVVGLTVYCYPRRRRWVGGCEGSLAFTAQMKCHSLWHGGGALSRIGSEHAEHADW
jgi:hypothetical protein